MGVAASIGGGAAAARGEEQEQEQQHQRGRRRLSGGKAADVGGLFVDANFPATDESLYFDKSAVNWPNNIVWKRPSLCQGLPQKVTDGEIGPSDIVQGALGDCYLLSALSVLAERPERVLRLFPTSTAVSATGRYVVRLYKDGIPRDVTVDDHIPCISAYPQGGGEGSYRPVFSTSKTGELWPLLVEKAYAKAHGSYQHIESGAGPEALEDLTGMPSTVMNVREMDPETCFAEILEADRRNYIMTASTREGDSEAEALGFVTGHQYGVLAAKSKGALRLLQIRNPWGNTEWKGDWSDGSPLWTADLKAHFGWSDADDGTFWMHTNDFVRYFDTLAVVPYEDAWQTRAVQLPTTTTATARGGGGTEEEEEEQVVVQVKVPHSPNQGETKVTAWFSVKMEDKRCCQHPTTTDYKYPKVRFQVVRTEPPEHRGVLHWSREADDVRDLHEKLLDLATDTTYHVIITRQHHHHRRQHHGGDGVAPVPAAGVSLAVYCPLAVELTVCQLPSLEDGRCMLSKIYETEALRSGKLVTGGEHEYRAPQAPQQQQQQQQQQHPPHSNHKDEKSQQQQQQHKEGEGGGSIYRKELCFPWGMAVVLVNATSGAHDGGCCLEVSECSELQLDNLQPLRLADHHHNHNHKPSSSSSTTTTIEQSKAEEGLIKITQKVRPGETSSYVLFSSQLAKTFSYSRRRVVVVRDLEANSVASLRGLLSEAKKEGIKQAFVEGQRHIHSYSYDLPQGFAMVVCNGSASKAVLRQELTFEVDGMVVYTLLPDGKTVTPVPPSEASSSVVASSSSSSAPPPQPQSSSGGGVEAAGATEQQQQQPGGGGGKTVGVSLVLKPGESQLLVLRATEEGEIAGFSFGYAYEYSIEAIK